MDVDAKNLSAWRFGDILANDPFQNGRVGSIRVMFVFPDLWAETFDALDLSGWDPIITSRHAPFWMRVERAER